LDTKKNGQLPMKIRPTSRGAAKCLTLAIRNSAPAALVFSLSFLFPLLSPFSIPKWAPTESDTAQLMATVVAGRAYLAATSHTMKI
jgi:hypothetical protein